MGLWLELGMLLAMFAGIPQQEKYEIQGTISVKSGLADSSFLVRLEDPAAQTIAEVYADSAGSFTFTNVQAGWYYVRIRQAGFQETLRKVNVLASSPYVNIFVPRNPEFPAAENETLPGSKDQVNLRQLGEPKTAVRQFRKALEYKKRSDVSHALVHLMQAIEIAPDFTEAYIELGKIHLDKSDLESAVDAFSRGVASDATSAAAAFYLGCVLYRMRRFEESEHALLQAHHLESKQPQIRLMLANVLVHLKKFQEALSQLDAYLDDYPNGDARPQAERMRAGIRHALAK